MWNLSTKLPQLCEYTATPQMSKTFINLNTESVEDCSANAPPLATVDTSVNVFCETATNRDQEKQTRSERNENEN